MANQSQSPVDILKKKVSPLLRSSRTGSRPGELLAPKGISVDPDTDYIFIADEGNNRVQVFDPMGQYLYKFGKDHSLQMKMPYGVKVAGGLVFVSQYSWYRVDVYTTDGVLVSSTVDAGLYWPTGLEVECSLGGDIYLYVCSSARSSIIVFSDEGIREVEGTGPESRFVQPKDVKVCQDKLLVLDLRNPCLHVFSLDGEYERSLISNGIGRDVAGPLFFCTHPSGLIIIGDNQSNRVKMFSSTGQFLHEVGVDPGGGERFVRSSSLMSHLVHCGLNSLPSPSICDGLVKCPRGVALSSKLNLVVVGLTNVGCVQIF